MTRVRTTLLAILAVLVLTVAYLTLDIYDKVPGFLTRADAPRAALPSPGATGTPTLSVAPPSPSAGAGQDPADASGDTTAAQVAEAVKGPLSSDWLGAQTGVVVRDAKTGDTLFDQDGATPLQPASVTKLVSAFAVAHTLHLQKRLTTKVVAGGGDHIVLVAGGDTLLNPGKGNPAAVNGFAGLTDLAAQVAGSLRSAGRTNVVLDVDASYAPGPLTVPAWEPDFLASGYTARIAMLGLSTQRAHTGVPATADPVASTTAALAKNLKAQGISVTIGSSAKGSGATLGSVQSAPLVDLLGLALQDSDNAMIESLTRQAAFSKGVAGDDTSMTDWVEQTIRGGGHDTTGLQLADVCGLAAGTTIPPRLLADLLVAGASGADPTYAQVMSRLPVGGLNGTLDDRFLRSTNSAGAGAARAKTGSLTGVSSLAGTVTTRSGDLLVFAIVSDGAQAQGPLGARAAIDNTVAALAGL